MSLSQKNNKLKKKKDKNEQKNTKKILLKSELTLPYHQEKKNKSIHLQQLHLCKYNWEDRWQQTLVLFYFLVPIVLLCDGPYVAGDISCSQKSRLQHHEWRLSNSMSAGEKEGWQVSVKTSADILKCKTVDKPPCEMVKEPLDSEVHSVSQCKYLPWTPVLYESFKLTPHTIEGCYN